MLVWRRALMLYCRNVFRKAGGCCVRHFDPKFRWAIFPSVLFWRRALMPYCRNVFRKAGGCCVRELGQKRQAQPFSTKFPYVPPPKRLAPHSTCHSHAPNSHLVYLQILVARSGRLGPALRLPLLEPPSPFPDWRMVRRFAGNQLRLYPVRSG